MYRYIYIYIYIYIYMYSDTCGIQVKKQKLHF